MSRSSRKQPKERRYEQSVYQGLGPLPLWQWPLVWLAGVVPMMVMGYVLGGLGMWEGVQGGMLGLSLALGLLWTAIVGFSIRDQYREKRARQ
jgi:hypothetical protein